MYKFILIGLFFVQCSIAFAKQGVVIGAGITGLMDALVLSQEGYEVIVLEKSAPLSNRFNMVNLKFETESMLTELGLIEDFSREVASRLTFHQYYRFDEHLNQYSLMFVEDVSSLHAKDPIDFSSTHLETLFQKDGLYTVSLGQFQKFLSEKAKARGVVILNDVGVLVHGGETKVVTVTQGGIRTELHPDLIIIADGSSGGVLQEEKMFARSVDIHHLCHEEKWIFGNVDYSGTNAFVTVLVDKSKEAVEIANIIFNPKNSLANVAVTVQTKDLDEDQIRERIESIARIAFDLNHIPGPARVVALNSKVVEIKNKTSHQFHLGANVVIAGDRAGVSSPLAGLGATLGVSTYPFAIRNLVREFRPGEDNSNAFAQYDELVRASIEKWKATSAATIEFIRTHF